MTAPAHWGAPWRLDPLYLTARGGKAGLSGYLVRTLGGGDSAASCQEFTIDCIEEEDDTCCATLELCLEYCEEVCHGPCAQAN